MDARRHRTMLCELFWLILNEQLNVRLQFNQLLYASTAENSFDELFVRSFYYVFAIEFVFADFNVLSAEDFSYIAGQAAIVQIEAERAFSFKRKKRCAAVGYSTANT